MAIVTAAEAARRDELEGLPLPDVRALAAKAGLPCPRVWALLRVVGSVAPRARALRLTMPGAQRVEVRELELASGGSEYMCTHEWAHLHCTYLHEYE
jgi:hypothetical protein